MNAIIIKQVTYQYGTEVIVNNINLEIYQKDYLGIIGPNGGGKSTLIKLMIGLLQPTMGTISVCPHTRLSYVPQNITFNKDFPITIQDVILTGRLSKLQVFLRYRPRDYNIAENLMKQLGLWELRALNCNQLSGGQLQKVLIARALVSDPDIILLDEPTAHVDPACTDEIYRYLKELNQTKTIIIVSHDTSGIAPYIKRLAYLNRTLLEVDMEKMQINNGSCYPIITQV